jgi:hypothetical protein
VAGHRAERLAENEAIFRLANERMLAWEERHRGEQPEFYYCECADSACRKKLELRRSEYEAVREDSRQFFVAKGHAVTSTETVIAQHDGYDVVRKNEDVRRQVEDSDPRRG